MTFPNTSSIFKIDGQSIVYSSFQLERLLKIVSSITVSSREVKAVQMSVLDFRMKVMFTFEEYY